MARTYNIDGSIVGSAGAYISFTLGPYPDAPDEGEMQSILIGLGELLATQGQFVTDCRVHPTVTVGAHESYYAAQDARKRVEPDVARERNEKLWETAQARFRGCAGWPQK